MVSVPKSAITILRWIWDCRNARGNCGLPGPFCRWIMHAWLSDCYSFRSMVSAMYTYPHPFDPSISIPDSPVQGKDPAVRLETYAQVARLGIGEQFSEVIALTREIFGEFTVDVSEDPEIYNYFYVSFTITVCGSAGDCLQQTSEWHRRLPRCATPVPGSFCLLTRFEHEDT
jgi:hypothetical protein